MTKKIIILVVVLMILSCNENIEDEEQIDEKSSLEKSLESGDFIFVIKDTLK